MDITRVAVVSVHPLFGRGIAQLLGADKHLEVVCLIADGDDTPEALRRLKPHAIVLEGCTQASFVREMARDLPAALFIGVRSQENVMDVFQQWQVRDACPEDLVRAIRVGMKGPSKGLPARR